MTQHMMILGGGRMIGPPLVSAAVERGWEVTMFTRQSPPPPQVADRVRHVRGDRGDQTAIDELAGLRPDVVVDLSSYEHEHVKRTIDTLGPVVSRYLLMSTGAVYRAISPMLPFDESTPLGSDPFWGQYGADKLAVEELAASVAERVPMVALRAPYLVGEPDFMRRLQFIADRVAYEPQVFVSDSGNAPVHLVAPVDVAGALLHLSDVSYEPDTAFSAFNIGNRRFTTLNGLVEAVAEAMGHPCPEVVPVDLASVGLGNAPFSWADMVYPFADRPVLLDDTKLREAGFIPSLDLSALLDDFVRRYADVGGPMPPTLFPAEKRAIQADRSPRGR